MMSKLHISIDDVKGIFKALISENYDDIFQTRTLAFLYDLHIKYGTEFTLYCTYRHNEYSMEKVSDKYRKQFMANNDWLKFEFHCYDELMSYRFIDVCEFIKHYRLFESERLRIVGQEESMPVIRIHDFSADKDMICWLIDKGIKMVLTADDDRQCYYLNDNEIELIKEVKKIVDEEVKVTFVKSFTRLENVENLEKELDEYMEKESEIIPIFTHEYLMDREDIRQKMEICCKIDYELREAIDNIEK